MSDEEAHKRWADQARKPFEPIVAASGKGIDTDAALRMAHASPAMPGGMGGMGGMDY